MWDVGRNRRALQHSDSLKTISACQLQALVRRRAFHPLLERAARRSKVAPALRFGDCLCAATLSTHDARRGTPVARPWGVGRGEPRLVSEHPSSAPRAITVPNEFTKECLWSGSAPPNGSRLSCGRLTRRRKSSG